MGERPAGVSIQTRVELCPSDLMSALHIFFGPSAAYTSVDQQELVEFSAGARTGHGHADLPCGSGKSMAWTLPVAARLLSGRIGCTIVVSPYKFLSSFHKEATCQFLEGTTDAWIVALNGSDFRGTSLPDELSVDGIVPDILFLSIDALAAFVERQRPRLARLCREGSIHRFVLDEIHTILVEGFRPVYETLAQLPSFGVPILTMSGSLPIQFRHTVLKYIGVAADGPSIPGSAGDVKMIGGGDVLGEFPSDFSFSCNVVQSPREVAIQAIKQHRSMQQEGTCIHVMVAAKTDAVHIASELETASISHRLLTADLSISDQDKIAKEWRDSRFSVLVSTSIAVVGNENPLCRHLVVCGYLYNLINMVQAINRLRPAQRHGGSVRILLPKYSRQHIVSTWDRDQLKFAALAERGLVPNDADLWKMFGSIEGLNHWLVEEDGCWIANLLQKFGTSRNSCGMCDRCKGSAVIVSAVSATSAVSERNRILNVARNVLRRLHSECIVCGSEMCNGEGCLPRGACFVCGGAHRRNMCAVDWKKVLCNKGCFSCLDPFFRQGYRSHDAKSCPLQRRLKRVVIHTFCKSEERCLETFYARITSEKQSFYAFLAAVAARKDQQPVTVFNASQVMDADESAPLLPPDYYDNADLGQDRRVDCNDADQSRNLYKFLKTQNKSCRRQREFVFGALYKNLIGNNYAVINCSRGRGKRVDLHVEIEDGSGTKTTVTILNASGCKEMLDSVVGLGSSLGTSGNARKNVGDHGEMWGLGYRNKQRREKYVITEQSKVKRAMRSVCRNVERHLVDKLPDSFQSIQKAEEDAECPPLEEMGGSFGLGSVIMISRNLGNSSHLDVFDKSLSVAVWAEERVGSARNWYFVLPNMKLNGKMGVVVKLFHGCVISWDGTLVKHCTSITETGSGNNVYGCMFGRVRQ